MTGKKTHEKQVRTFERRDDYHRRDDQIDSAPGTNLKNQEARQSEFPVSRGGMNQESRQHNKHNDSAKGGSK
ncbi:hypothetical protein [Limoniibacter endophyticus]|uniref:Uncharacterized protein n=1 Tax=Limoniibacter endophyticus TaxID=1565040 RepID=A0A8J3GHV6_9HYPH|nr:hypothetical protein [Limoniibacter endophyticus]GHC68616.1 hypothetical protein GCM10010136_13500 [Limoniibacter endophyticus]